MYNRGIVAAMAALMSSAGGAMRGSAALLSQGFRNNYNAKREWPGQTPEERAIRMQAAEAKRARRRARNIRNMGAQA